MRNTSLIILLLLLSAITLTGQKPVGEWSEYLVYKTAYSVAAGDQEVFASNGSSIMVYNKDMDELRKMSKINGLTETGISAIAWSYENKTLAIGYSSTNVDLVKDNIIYNIPDISRKYISGRKVINNIRCNGRYAYFACSFGIVVIDLVKNEVYDTWKPGNGTGNYDVWDIAFGNGKIYAATGSGVYQAETDDQGLSYYGNWKPVEGLPDPAGNYNAVVYAGNKLFVNRVSALAAGDMIYAIDGTNSLISSEPGIYNQSFDNDINGFIVSSRSKLRFYDTAGQLVRTISSYSSQDLPAPNIAKAVTSEGAIWIADIGCGLIRGEGNSSFTALSLPGPLSNDVISISAGNGNTIICGGAITGTWNNVWSPFKVSVFSDNKWNLMPVDLYDPLRSVTDPGDKNHFFVSTWGSGLMEYKDNKRVKQYTEANSPLQNIIPGKYYVRVCGLAWDADHNLWVTQTEVPGSLKALKPDGTWIVNPVRIDAPTIGDLMISSTGLKWVILPRGYGLFVLDDNKTPEVFTDDIYRKVTVRDAENATFPYVYSLAEDLDGNVWVGTDQGPLVYYNTSKIAETDIPASRIKIPRNDGSGLADYLLNGEVITSIAVDGANRKWIGTASSGAFLLSPDGLEKIRNYNEQNSPLLSNSITSIAVDNNSGEVWFGTSKGVQSVRGDATSGNEDFSRVYAFPNPVREDFTGNITIAGLLRDTQIRITDISGNLVYETVSDGGMATWDLKTYNDRRVATGVYLVFCASSDGSAAHVIKILVIH